MNYVFDTDDFTTSVSTDNEVRQAVRNGYKVYDRSKINLGLKRVGDYGYELLIGGNNAVIFRDKFPRENDRNDLYAHEITMRNIFFSRNNIIVRVSCFCWCKYDIEFPLVAEHYVRIPVNKKGLGYIGICAYTSYPVYVGCYMDLEGCEGDCPDNIIANVGKTIIDDTRVQILGVKFSDIPVYYDLCKDIVE